MRKVDLVKGFLHLLPRGSNLIFIIYMMKLPHTYVHVVFVFVMVNSNLSCHKSPGAFSSSSANPRKGLMSLPSFEH